MLGELVLGTTAVGLVVERSVSAAILVDGLEQVIVAAWVKWLVGHLRAEGRLREIAVQ